MTGNSVFKNTVVYRIYITIDRYCKRDRVPKYTGSCSQTTPPQRQACSLFTTASHSVTKDSKGRGIAPKKRPDGQSPGLVRAAWVGSMATKQRWIPIPPFLAILSRCAREGCVSNLKWCKASSTQTKDWPLVNATTSNHTPKTSKFWHMEQLSLHPMLLVASSHDAFFRNLIRLRALARLLGTSSSSSKRYLPSFSVSLGNEDSTILVKQSASWAPLSTHLRDTFSVRNSCLPRAFKIVFDIQYNFVWQQG